MTKYRSVHSDWSRSSFVRALVLFVAVGLLGAQRLEAQGYQVVVNSGNAVSSLTADEVSRLFLKRTTRWPDGSTVVPVDLPEGSAVRIAFSQGVHGRSVSAIKALWQRQIYSGRAVPPVEKASDAEVLAYVRANRTAIGYVAAGASIGAGVKVLRVTGG